MDWDDLRFVLAVHRASSVAGAASGNALLAALHAPRGGAALPRQLASAAR